MRCENKETRYETKETLFTKPINAIDEARAV